jgi:hypothetical protein
MPGTDTLSPSGSRSFLALLRLIGAIAAAALGVMAVLLKAPRA